MNMCWIVFVIFFSNDLFEHLFSFFHSDDLKNQKLKFPFFDSDDPKIERLRERPAYYNAEGKLPDFDKPVYELHKAQWRKDFIISCSPV